MRRIKQFWNWLLNKTILDENLTSVTQEAYEEVKERAKKSKKDVIKAKKGKKRRGRPKKSKRRK
tara:strand:+ start:155 stop:346 length:192 start_codon:yes stop_codon:yes gene_type:complete